MRLDHCFPGQVAAACRKEQTMLNTETEIQRLALAMIERHRSAAAKAAVARLNQMIDRGDRDGMERWACVVSVIHRSQGAGPAFSGRKIAAAGAVAPRV